MPDPTIEATRGVGNVSAYRGRMLAVFTNMDLGTSGQIPQFEFVTSRNLSSAQERIAFNDAPFDDDWSIAGVAVAGIPTASEGWHIAQGRTSTYQVRMDVWRTGPGYASKHATYLFNYAAPQLAFLWTPVNCPGKPAQMLSSDAIVGGGAYVDVLDLASGARERIYEWPTGAQRLYALQNNITAARDPVSGTYAVALMNDNSMTYERAAKVSIISSGQESLCPLVPSGYLSAVAAYDHAVYVLNMQLDGRIHLLKYVPVGGELIGGATMVLVSDITGPLYGGAVGVQTYALSWALQVTADGVFAWVRTGASELYRIDGTWQLVSGSAAPEYGKYQQIAGLIHVNEDYFIVGPSNVYGTPERCRYNLIRYDARTVADVSVADVILGEHAMAGQDASRVDVSDLVGLQIHGYPVGRVASARSTIEPILAAFFLDSYDAGDRRKYVRRAAGTVAAWISYDELGAVEAGSQPTDPFPLVHANRDEWPRSLTVNFIDKTNDYQPGSQVARRNTVLTGGDEVMELAIATTPDHAATIAHVQLYNRWSERDTRSASVLRTYAYLDPSDHVMVEYPRDTWSRWVIGKLVDTGTLIKLEELVPVDPALYDEIVVGFSSGGGQVVSALPPPTRSLRLDIPILRDGDDNAGIYVPMGGLSPDYPGGALWIGADDTTLEPRGTVEAEAVIGYAETVLGDWTSHRFDHASSVIVQLREDQQLDSALHADVYAAEANAIVLGSEILCYQDATSLGDGRWRLTGFLRGLRGTEQHRASHAANERFVLLAAGGILRPTFQLSELGLVRSYRALTAGRALESAASETDVNTGVGLKPLSPVHLRRTRASDGAITATWDRRSRLAQNVSLGTVPLGEASEAYQLVIYTSNAYATERRVIATTSPTATYTAAMQTADGVTPGAVAYARVFQISDKVGRGFPLQGTL